MTITSSQRGPSRWESEEVDEEDPNERSSLIGGCRAGDSSRRSISQTQRMIRELEAEGAGAEEELRKQREILVGIGRDSKQTGQEASRARRIIASALLTAKMHRAMIVGVIVGLVLIYILLRVFHFLR